MHLEIPKNIDINFKKGKSQNTINTYMFMLSKLFREALNSDKFSVKSLHRKDDIVTYLSSLSLTTKKLMTIAVVMILKAADAPKELIDFYGKLARKYRIEDKILRRNRAATTDERMYHITWEWVKLMKKQYKHFIDNVDEKSILDSAYKRLQMGYVVFDLLTTIPPQRGEALFNCYVDRDIKGSNQINTKKKLWIIRASKTQRTFGVRKIPLTDSNIGIINKWMKISNCRDKLLICNDLNEKMSTQSYTQFLNNTLFRTDASRNISTDDLRKAYVTHMIVHEGISIDERKSLADLMGHSYDTMMSLYFKPDLETNILLGGRIIEF